MQNSSVANPFEKKKEKSALLRNENQIETIKN